MWGHSLGCGCAICHSLPRLFDLISQGSRYPGFVGVAGERVRLLESEVRDLLAGQLGAVPRAASVASPAAPLPPPPAPQPSVPKAQGPLVWRRPLEAVERRDRGAGRDLNAKDTLEVYPKGGPGAVFGKAEPGSFEVKEEVGNEDKGPVAEAVEEPKEKKKDKKKDKKRREKSRSESKGRKRKRSRSEEREVQKGSSKDKRLRRSERSRSEKGEEESPRKREERGRERREDSEDHKREESQKPESKRPREPERSPPKERREDWRGRTQGRGWRGEIPYSNHPRWTQSKNKGIVKRAKQELHNRRKFLTR